MELTTLPGESAVVLLSHSFVKLGAVVAGESEAAEGASEGGEDGRGPQPRAWGRCRLLGSEGLMSRGRTEGGEEAGRRPLLVFALLLSSATASRGRRGGGAGAGAGGGKKGEADEAGREALAARVSFLTEAKAAVLPSSLTSFASRRWPDERRRGQRRGERSPGLVADEGDLPGIRAVQEEGPGRRPKARP